MLRIWNVVVAFLVAFSFLALFLRITRGCSENLTETVPDWFNEISSSKFRSKFSYNEYFSIGKFPAPRTVNYMNGHHRKLHTLERPYISEKELEMKEISKLSIETEVIESDSGFTEPKMPNRLLSSFNDKNFSEDEKVMPNSLDVHDTNLKNPSDGKGELSIEANTDSFNTIDGYPIQLIYPDENHVKLLINATSLEVLSNISSHLAVVAVVGPLHSGKSFLVNQLLNRTSGFSLGDTTRPKTRGLWMWSNPLSIPNQNHQIIFLDTEGLFSNVGELYDAKIFAVSTLLSSFLIYNSVKFVDQSSIDSIELLTKRAQLFGFQSELEQRVNHSFNYAENTEIFKNFVSTPKLLWVIQDFVQRMEDDLSPKEWLNSILKNNQKNFSVSLTDDGVTRPKSKIGLYSESDSLEYDGADASYSSSDEERDTRCLNLIFPSVDCFTLYIPQYEYFKLQHLDKVNEEDLLPEYKKGMSILRQKIVQEAPIKSKGPKYLNGLGLATLLQTLVEASNNAVFPQIPSIWKSFQQLSIRRSIEDCVKFYRKSWDSLITTVPMSRSSMLSNDSRIRSNSKNVFLQLTVGIMDLEGSHYELEMELESHFDLIFSSLKNFNEVKLDEFIRDKFTSMEDSFVSGMKGLEFPLPVTHLERVLLDQKGIVLDEYNSSLVEYVDDNSFVNYYIILRDKIQKNIQLLVLQNGQKIEAKLKEVLEDMLLQSKLIVEERIDGKIEEQTKDYYQKVKFVESKYHTYLLNSRSIENRSDDSNELKVKRSPDLNLLVGELNAKIWSIFGRYFFTSKPKAVDEGGTVDILPSSFFCFEFLSSNFYQELVLLPNYEAFKKQHHSKIFTVVNRRLIDEICDNVRDSFFEEWSSMVKHYDLSTSSSSRWMNYYQVSFAGYKAQVLKNAEEKLRTHINQEISHLKLAISDVVDRSFHLPQPNDIIEGLIELIEKEFGRIASLRLEHLQCQHEVKLVQLYLRDALKDEENELKRRNIRKFDSILTSTLPMRKSEFSNMVMQFWTPWNARRFALEKIKKILQENQQVVHYKMLNELAERFIDNGLGRELELVRNRMILVISVLVAFIVFVYTMSIRRRVG